MNTNRPAGGRVAQGGYSLVELLGVMLIMAILLAVLVPSLSGMNEGNNLTQGGQLFADQVALARQTASAKNITVEVRCINVPIRSQNGYSAIQLWSTNTGAPISRVQTMPDGIAISDNIAVSTFFDATKGYRITGNMAGGGPLNGDAYVSFTINPSGVVGPLVPPASSATPVVPNMTALSVAIMPARSVASGTFPVNYMLVQLNPLTAATITYRP